MKYLSDYISEKQTAIFNETGAFFAFYDKQFLEGKKEGIKYVHLGGGLLCPEEKAEELVTGLDNIYKAGIKQDLEENGREGVIKRELSNHEAYYTGDIDSTVEVLTPYGITREEIQAIYKEEFKNQDL